MWHAERSRRLVVLAFLMLVLPRAAAMASVLSLCPGDAAQGAILARGYDAVDGPGHTLRLDEAAPSGCTSLALPVAADAIAAIALLPPALAAPGVPALSLAHSGDDRHPVINAVEDAAAAAPSAPLIAPGRDLLPGWAARAFGSEERAELRRTRDGISLVCAAGAHPAGLVAEAPARLPPLATLALAITAAGDGGFVLAVADRPARRRDAPLAVATLAASGAPRITRAALPIGLNRAEPLTWSLLCPAQGGTLTLTRLSLDAENETSRAATRAAWAWDAALWQEKPAALIERAAGRGLRRLYISVPIRDGAVTDPASLRAFLSVAARQDIAVWAVEGDPHAVLPGKRETFRRRAAALAAFNAAGGERLAGVQYDIEPYLDPGYALAPKRWTDAYLATLALLADAAEMPVEAAVPFWFPFERRGARLAEIVASIAVMDYRSAADAIEDFALPALAWGETYRRPVWIGLEFGALGDERRDLYRRSASGTLWRVPIGNSAALLLLASPAANPLGETYARASGRTIPATLISLQGHEDEAFATLLPDLARRFAVWPDFAGFALHGLF